VTEGGTNSGIKLTDSVIPMQPKLTSQRGHTLLQYDHISEEFHVYCIHKQNKEKAETGGISGFLPDPIWIRSPIGACSTCMSIEVEDKDTCFEKTEKV
jgi:hypothetical protein